MSDADYRTWVEVLPSFERFNTSVESGLVSGISQGFAQQRVAQATAAGTSGVANIVSGALTTAGSVGAAGATRGLLSGLTAAAGPIGLAIAGLGIGVVLADTITNAIKNGVDAGLTYIQTSVLAAADLEQNVGAVTAIFKDNADQIEAWSKASAESVGLSRNSYLQYSSVVGAQLKNLGIPETEVAAKTDELIRLGADLSAQFGGPTSDAVMALSSLLRGERDPIERYGVSIKQVQIDAGVAAMGLGDLTLEQQRQAEILATLNILYGQTADAQGTFARESDTFLNVQQRTQAVLEDTATEFGEALLPVLTEVLGFVKDELVPLWQEFNKQVGPELGASLEKMWPKVEKFAEEILPLIPPVLLGIIAAMNLFLDVVSDLISRVELVTGTFSDFFALLSGDMSLEDFVKNWNTRITEWGQSIRDVFTNFSEPLSKLGQMVSTALNRLVTRALEAGKALIGNLVQGLKSGISAAGKDIQGVFQKVADFLPHSPAKRGPFSGSGWAAVADAGRAIMQQFASGMGPVDVPLGFDAGALSIPASRFIPAEAFPGASTVGAATEFEIGPRTLPRIIEALMSTRELVADGAVLATTASKGSAFNAAIGAS